MDPKRSRDEDEPKTSEPATKKKPDAPAVLGFGGFGFKSDDSIPLFNKTIGNLVESTVNTPTFGVSDPAWSAAMDDNNFHNVNVVCIRNPFAEPCLHICRTSNVRIFNVVFKPSGYTFGWEVCTVHVQSAILSTITYNKTQLLDDRIDWNSLRDLITQETNSILNANTAIAVNRTAARTRGFATTKNIL
jgi:hypothetical protein